MTTRLQEVMTCAVDVTRAITTEPCFERRDYTVRYRRGGRVLAVATVSRDRESMEAELATEREIPFERSAARTLG